MKCWDCGNLIVNPDPIPNHTIEGAFQQASADFMCGRCGNVYNQTTVCVGKRVRKVEEVDNGQG